MGYRVEPPGHQERGHDPESRQQRRQSEDLVKSLLDRLDERSMKAVQVLHGSPCLQGVTLQDLE